MKSGLLVSLAGCCATGALGYYAGSQSISAPARPMVIPAAPTPASIRIALVDMGRIFDSHPRTKTSAAEINALRADAKRESQRLSEGGDESAATRYRETRTKEIQAESARLRAQIVAEIQTIVTKAARESDFDLVLDSSGKSLNNVPVVLHAAGLTNITEDILDDFKR